MLGVHGGEIFVETFGRATALPPIVFVHGWALDRRVWTPQVAAFAVDRLVVTYDRRGYGRSTAPADLIREVDDLIALLDTVDAPEVIVVAMSQGARIAVEVARLVRNRIVGLALLGAPPAAGSYGDDGAYAPPIDALRDARSQPERARLLQGHPLFALPGGSGATIRDAILADYRGEDLAAVPVTEFGSASRLPDDLPTLFLHGEHDAGTRIASAHSLVAARPTANVALLSGAGHLANLCSPRVFNAALGRFVARLAGE